MSLATKITAGVLWQDGALYFIDQTKLPGQIIRTQVFDIAAAEEAIISLRVRGAPAIATFACFALVVELTRNRAGFAGSIEAFRAAALSVVDRLERTRPTAVNLSNAMRRMRQVLNEAQGSVDLYLAALLQTAESVQTNDKLLCERLGNLGAELIPAGAKILTHCNTGALATAGIGTAIGAFTTAHELGKNISVFACETRPLLQGARLTAWELDASGIKTTLITDSMAAHIMREEKINLVMVGADRIAHNGDTANKIGTYGLAVLARHHSIPFYVVAPSTSIDSSLANGSGIEIEERPADEVRRFLSVESAPAHIPVRNPAFDITPAELISAIITENGIHRSPFAF